MLATLLLHRMTTMNTKRRKTAEKQADTKKCDLNMSQNDICRTCLSTEKLRLIFCNSSDQQMSFKLKLVTNLEIKKNDHLSQKICFKCLRIIDQTLDFRIKCKRAEDVLLGIKNNIKTETSKPNKSTKEFSFAASDITQVKVEYDGDSGSGGYQQNVKLETINDIKPIIHKNTCSLENSIHGVENIPFNRNLPIDRPIKDEKLSIWARNNITVKKVKTSKHVRPPPKTSSERQKTYRAKLKLQRDGKLGTVKAKSADKVPAHRTKIERLQEQKEKPPPKTSSERQKTYRAKLKLQRDGKLGTVKAKSADKVPAHRTKIESLQEQKRKGTPVHAQRARRVYRELPPGPPYRCETCGKEFQERIPYLTHTRRHVSFFICECCGKKCWNRYTLLQHRRSWHGDAKIQCSRCDYSAVTQESLNVHERKHRNERPYVCDYCTVGFLTRNTLIQHIGVHMPRTIQCPFCPKKLQSLRILSNHKAAKHGKRYNYLCPRCPRDFKDRKYVRRHLLNVHLLPREEHPDIEKVRIWHHLTS